MSRRRVRPRSSICAFQGTAPTSRGATSRPRNGVSSAGSARPLPVITSSAGCSLAVALTSNCTSPPSSRPRRARPFTSRLVKSSAPRSSDSVIDCGNVTVLPSNSKRPRTRVAASSRSGSATSRCNVPSPCALRSVGSSGESLKSGPSRRNSTPRSAGPCSTPRSSSVGADVFRLAKPASPAATVIPPTSPRVATRRMRGPCTMTRTSAASSRGQPGT